MAVLLNSAATATASCSLQPILKLNPTQAGLRWAYIEWVGAGGGHQPFQLNLAQQNTKANKK